jgi:hypothetical protein
VVEMGRIKEHVDTLFKFIGCEKTYMRERKEDYTFSQDGRYTNIGINRGQLQKVSLEFATTLSRQFTHLLK